MFRHGFADSLNLSVAAAMIMQRLLDMSPGVVGGMGEEQRQVLRHRFYPTMARKDAQREYFTACAEQVCTSQRVSACLLALCACVSVCLCVCVPSSHSCRLCLLRAITLSVRICVFALRREPQLYRSPIYADQTNTACTKVQTASHHSHTWPTLHRPKHPIRSMHQPTPPTVLAGTAKSSTSTPS